MAYSGSGRGSFGGGDVEASSLALVFHQASLVVAHVEQHLTQQVLQVLVGCDLGPVQVVEPRETDVERGAELMGGGIHRVPVDASQPFDGVRRAQQAGDYHAVLAAAATGQRVDEVPAYVAQHLLGLGYQIGERVLQLVDGVILIAPHLHDGPRGEVSLPQAAYGTDAEAFGGGVLILVGVVEHLHQRSDVAHPDAAVVWRVLAGLDGRGGSGGGHRQLGFLLGGVRRRLRYGFRLGLGYLRRGRRLYIVYDRFTVYNYVVARVFSRCLGEGIAPLASECQ